MQLDTPASLSAAEKGKGRAEPTSSELAARTDPAATRDDEALSETDAAGTADWAKSTAPGSDAGATFNRLGMAIIVIGLAGSGKTTFVQRLNAHMHAKKRPPYLVNLDPAVSKLPYTANIDIRDSVNYADVMKQYRLGPNGAIMTSLSLFVTRFDQVLGYIEKRAQTSEHIIIDSPGQIELFTWSASGAIITDAIASAIPTCVAYIIDTARTASPVTFMSNMLYACSIMYKTRLPFVLVFNKTDVLDHHFALEWMSDFEAFQAALTKHRDENDTEDGPSYMNSLMNSMCLVLEAFYKQLKAVGLSAMTGKGIEDFLVAVEGARHEYDTPELDKLAAERDAAKVKSKQEQLARLVSDMKVDGAIRKPPSRFAASQHAAPTASRDDDDDVESDSDWEEGPDAPRKERMPTDNDGPRRAFGGIEDDGLGGRWPAPR